jgi:RNA polymerase sigma-70 factor (ECF subfamily)
MSAEQTTVLVQRCLDALGDASAPQQVISDLLTRAVHRLHKLCGGLLHQNYPRLMRPPLCLSTDEVLGGVVERLIKALRQVRPSNVRQFFALANQHIRWELNDLARRLDKQTSLQGLPEEIVASDSSASQLTSGARRILEAIDSLPEEDREVFDLVRIQGLTHEEVAELLGVATKTVQRRLHRALVLLAERLHDLAPRD